MTVREYKLESGPRRGVVLYEVDGFNFDTKKEAEDFAKSDWPRPLPNGKVVTSDRVTFPVERQDLAEAREKNLGGK